MIKFEKVSKYNDIDIEMPKRATTGSAGYDFCVAEDIIIPPYENHLRAIMVDINAPTSNIVDLETLSSITKNTHAKPTLVPTGVKCKLDPDAYLELTVRSSLPLKSWLVLANGVGIIDSDYYGNSSNEGHIYFQLINLSPFSIQLHKGDRIGQGIIKHYLKTDDDNAIGERSGGFGSTSV